MGTPTTSPDMFPPALNRWLNINGLPGLTRVRMYFVIPAFNVAYTWRGYSELVAEYQYTAPNNFAIPPAGLLTLPKGTNYSLCVSYVNAADNSVVRYKLISGASELFYFNVPRYGGQLLKKNFSIEVWSNNDATAIQTTDIQLLTSVLGNIDYRSGANQSLVTASGIVTNFNPTDSSNVPQPNLGSWYKTSGIAVDGGGLITGWTNAIGGGIDLTPTNSPPKATVGFATGAEVISNKYLQTTGIIPDAVQHVFVGFYMPVTAVTSNVLFNLFPAFNSIFTIQMVTGLSTPAIRIYSIAANSVTFPLPSGIKGVIVEADLFNKKVSLYSHQLGTLTPFASRSMAGYISPAAGNSVTLRLGDPAGSAAGGAVMIEALLYTTVQNDNDRATILEHMVGFPFIYPNTIITN